MQNGSSTSKHPLRFRRQGCWKLGPGQRAASRNRSEQGTRARVRQWLARAAPQTDEHEPRPAQASQHAVNRSVIQDWLKRVFKMFIEKSL